MFRDTKIEQQKLSSMFLFCKKGFKYFNGYKDVKSCT